VISSQAFSKCAHADTVSTVLDGLFESSAVAGSGEVEIGCGSALKPVPTNEILLLRTFRQIPVANNVDAVCAVRSAVRAGLLVEAGQFALRARACRVIHQAAAEQATGVPQPLRVFPRR